MALTTIDEALVAVENRLQSVVQTDVALLSEASQHIIASGGKKLRPRLLFLAYQAAGGTDFEAVVPLAAAVELIHTATLVHDDINDHSLTRRDQITVHARWGRTFALLTGDYLFTKVYEMMAPYGRYYNMVMAEACVRLVEGETLQAVAAKAGTMDRETYKSVISRKTASLFEAAARMGAKHGGADEDLATALGRYAHYLGLAFQITDDILDIVGDPDTIGKPVGGDLAQGAGVVVAQNGSRQAVATAEAVVVADPIQAMLERLRDSGAIEVARFQAQEMAERARLALADVPDSPARREMESLINAVIGRER
jgi:geranylgeranyl pyrophosphate synthase